MEYVQMDCVQWLSSDSHLLWTPVSFAIINIRSLLEGGLVNRKQSAWGEKAFGILGVWKVLGWG